MKTLIFSLLMAFGLSIAAPVDVQACGDHKGAKKSDKSNVEQASYDAEKENAREATKDVDKKSESKKSEKIKARKKSEAESSSSTADVDDE